MWTARIPEVAAGSWYFEQLWVNGRRATRARTPNEFYFYVRGAVDRGVDPATGKDGDLTCRAFKARAEDVAPLRALPRDALNDVTVIAYHSWETSRSRVAGLSPTGNVVVLTAPIPWGFAYWGPNCRYHLENFRAALDAPGEWFLARDGTLSYMPLPGEDMTTAEVVAPVVRGLRPGEGRARGGEVRRARDLSGACDSEHGQYVLPPGGHADGQAEVTIPAAIMLDGARNVAFEDCEVAHIGTARHVVPPRLPRLPRDAHVVRGPRRRRRQDRRGLGQRRTFPRRRGPAAIVCDNNIIHSGGRTSPRRDRRLDRPQRLQPGHPQRHQRLLLHGRLGGLDVGLRARDLASQHDRLQPHPPPRLGRPERHGRRLHARASPRARP